MSAIASNSSLLSRLCNVVETGAADDASLASAQPAPLSAAWRRLVDQRLIEWGRASGHAPSDDDVEPPSPRAVRLTYEVIERLVAEGADAPTRAVPNGTGGISFEWESGPILWRMEIGDDGSIDSMLFDGAKLVNHLRHERGGD